MKQFFFLILMVLTNKPITGQPIENKITSKTIVFIHGLFMNSKSWEHWVAFYEAKGYQCYTPTYPFHQGNPSDLRKNHDSALGKLTFGEVITSLVEFIDQLPEKPILIGHSMGGLAVQKLIELDKGVAGICLNPAPPKGIFSFKWSFITLNLSTINPLKGNSACIPSLKWFHNAFCNTMDLEATTIEYNNFVVPESRNIPRSSTKKDGKINLKKTHAPLLIIAGEKDRIVPSSLNKKNFLAYKDKNSKIDFKEFKNRTHYICGQKNWEEVATYINNWIVDL